MLTDSQNYNRYGYCLNNPLKYTDPSGDFIEGVVFLVIPGYGWLGEAMWESSLWGPRSPFFGRYHSKFLPQGRRGILNKGMQTGIGWSNHGNRHVFRFKINKRKILDIYK